MAGDVRVPSLEALKDLLNSILPKLTRHNTKGIRIGDYEYKFWNELKHAELTICSWVPEDADPHKYDNLLFDEDTICFKPKFDEAIKIDRIAYLKSERKYGRTCRIWAPEEGKQFYEENISNLDVRWDINSGRMIEIIPKVTVTSPYKYVLSEDELSTPPNSIFVNTINQPAIDSYYAPFKFEVCGNVCKWGVHEIPLQIDIGQKIDELVHTKRGILDFINAVN